MNAQIDSHDHVLLGKCKNKFNFVHCWDRVPTFLVPAGYGGTWCRLFVVFHRVLRIFDSGLNLFRSDLFFDPFRLIKRLIK